MFEYHQKPKYVDKTLIVSDHLNGFDKFYKSKALDELITDNVEVVQCGYVMDHRVQLAYNTRFEYVQELVGGYGWERMISYNIHPALSFKNFICSFNGSDSIGRQLLSSILNNRGYFNSEYSSKNFAHDNNWITSHLDNLDLTENEVQLYSKFFTNDDEFNNTVYSFGHIRYKHSKNIYNLEDKLTQSFLHIVSETMSTSYYPFVTEKFLYSIVTRGLFLSYAQPGWHKHIERYYGFKLYDTIFDYSFDEIQNPVKRLVRLFEMVSKFSTLSVDDWKDLYHMEQDNIEYNYDHYFSRNYLKQLAQYE